MVGFWIGLRPRNLKKSSGGVLEVRLRRTSAFVFLHQAATVFDGLAWCFSLKSGLRPVSRLRRGCFAGVGGPLRGPFEAWLLPPRHEDLRPSRRGVTSSQGLWPCAGLRPVCWCVTCYHGLRPVSRLRRGCFLFFWWGGWELFGIRRKKKVDKLVIREKNDYLCHVERLFVSFFLPLMGVNG